MSASDEDALWFFGYGSLVWRAGFTYEERVVGFIKGFKRRFWQGSTDHRGVPERPGRVVTLVESNPESDEAEEITWGAAYRVAPERYEEVKQYLDHREQGGYSLCLVDVYDRRGHPPIIKKCQVYVGLNSNPNYLGDAPLEQIAAQIYRSIGPSGTNLEYLLQLCNAMRELAPQAHDPHLFGLERLVLELVEHHGPVHVAGAKAVIMHVAAADSSTETLPLPSSGNHSEPNMGNTSTDSAVYR